MKNNETVGVEIERKYIIEMPDFQILEKQEKYQKSDILQTYLYSSPGETRRVRRRTTDGVTRYIETRKIRIDKISSTEIERELDEEEYLLLLGDADKGALPIKKTRHIFIYKNQLFEIDVYPGWNKTAIMETELKSRTESVEIPEFIKIIREVSGDKAYSNAGMARRFPEEIKK